MQDKKLKELIVGAYESPLAAETFGEVFRPGGLKLTARAAVAAGINKDSLVLDFACGLGTTACFLARQYGCRVIGLDLSRKLIGQAQNHVRMAGLPDRVTLTVGDGEKLPIRNSAVDAVISECSFSLMPNKEMTAREINRVMRPGGRLSLTDIFLRGQPPREIQGRAGFIGCLAGAKPIEEYIEIFMQAGFGQPLVEDHSEDLKKTAYRMLIKSGSQEKFFSWLGGGTGSQDWTTVFREGRPGYALLTLTKSSAEGD